VVAIVTLALAPAHAHAVDLLAGGVFGAAGPGWRAGDVHVHTCYSHDSYCGPGDDNTGPDTAYSSGGTVAERFQEAALKGLDFLVISDHDDIRAQKDPGFGSAGVVGIAAYEASLAGGHAQMLGATRQYDKGHTETAAIAAASARAMAAALRRDGGLFQSNHPSYRAGAPVSSCKELELKRWQSDPLHWKYGFSVPLGSVEVWNATTLIRPSELFWECWLQRGARLGATGGSDSHGANQGNVGLPTTWVFARDSSPAAILAAIRAGRTTITRLPPAAGGARLLLEADRDGDGDYESMVGDTVATGTPMRVRAEGLAGAGLVRVRANGTRLVDGAQLLPGSSVRFPAPARSGWVYAELMQSQATRAADPGCQPTGQSLDTCSADLAITALTSPIYVERRGRPGWTGEPTAPIEPADDLPIVPGDDAHEPDREPPLDPILQSGLGTPLPDVPAYGAMP